MPRPIRRGEPPKLQPPMTPMIDCVFQLLLFFILLPSAQEGTQGYLTTNLPTHVGPHTGQQSHLIYVTINLKEDGGDPEWADVAITLNDDQQFGHNFGQLLAALNDKRARGLSADVPVLIKPTMATRHKWVVKAFDAAVKAGFKEINFAVPYE